jgi:transcriptional regulator with XRE-family HTH domain
MPSQPDHLEIPFGPEFGDRVVEGRRKAGYSQQRLASEVGVSQAVISDIERGIARSSSVVRTICAVLQIPLPVNAEDDQERRWIEAGRVLRARRPNLYARQLAFVEELVAEPPEPGNSGNDAGH